MTPVECASHGDEYQADCGSCDDAQAINAEQRIAELEAEVARLGDTATHLATRAGELLTRAEAAEAEVADWKRKVERDRITYQHVCERAKQAEAEVARLIGLIEDDENQRQALADRTTSVRALTALLVESDAQAAVLRAALEQIGRTLEDAHAEDCPMQYADHDDDAKCVCLSGPIMATIDAALATDAGRLGAAALRLARLAIEAECEQVFGDPTIRMEITDELRDALLAFQALDVAAKAEGAKQ